MKRKRDLHPMIQPETDDYIRKRAKETGKTHGQIIDSLVEDAKLVESGMQDTLIDKLINELLIKYRLASTELTDNDMDLKTIKEIVEAK